MTKHQQFYKWLEANYDGTDFDVLSERYEATGEFPQEFLDELEADEADYKYSQMKDARLEEKE